MTIETYEINSKTAGLWWAVVLNHQDDRLTRADRASGENSGTENRNVKSKIHGLYIMLVLFVFSLLWFRGTSVQ